MKKLVFAFLALMLAVGFVGLGFAGGKQEAEKQAAEKKETALTTMTFVSPRGTLEVMDDYAIWVAKEMGYFKEMGLDVKLEPGPNEALADIKLISQGQADIGYPSPGVLTAGIDAGIETIMVFEMMSTQVFDFAVRPDSPIQSVKELAGKTISLGFAGWDVIVSPMLVEIGVDPKSVTYVAAGSQWGQAVAAGKADAALCWKGLRAQWDAVGLKLKYFLGEDFSKMPANGLVARKSDLKDPVKRQNLINFCKGVAMGIHFARNNPRAAAQITYAKFPAVREQMTPDLALKSMNELHWAYTATDRVLGAYGTHPLDSWSTYLDITYKLGQTKKKLNVGDVVTNELIADVNKFDRARVEQDAKNFKLDDTWSKVTVSGNW